MTLFVFAMLATGIEVSIFICTHHETVGVITR